jgi:hypothetical protein
MNSAVISVELPEPLMHQAAESAEKSGVTISTWISQTVAQQLRIESVTERYFQRRGTDAEVREILAILDRAPNRQPDPGDEL